MSTDICFSMSILTQQILSLLSKHFPAQLKQCFFQKVLSDHPNPYYFFPYHVSFILVRNLINFKLPSAVFISTRLTFLKSGCLSFIYFVLPRIWTVVEKTLESPLYCKEVQPVHSKGDQSWVFIGRTDAEAEAPILWSPDVKNWLIGKDPDAGKDWRREEKGAPEEEMGG